MSDLLVLTIDQAEEWDKIVRSFSEYDVYYLSGYVKAFQLHGDGEPLLFYYEDSDLRGINVVMRRDIAADPHFSGKLPENTYIDYSTPYGYGGWLLEGEGDEDAVFSTYGIWCAKHGVISEFVRYHPILGNHARAARAYEVIPLGQTIAIDLASPETVWTNFSSTCRNKTRKAKKNDVLIYNGRSPELYEMFRQIYNETMDKDHAAKYYYFQPSFYGSILTDLPYNAQVFYAKIPDGTVIAAAIMLVANGRMSFHLGGSLREYQPLAPTNLLLYQAACWGCANGCRTLHLGGGVGSAKDSLFDFKKSFYRGEPNRFHIGRKIFLPDVYEELLKQRDNLPQDSGFFPKYRG